MSIERWFLIYKDFLMDKLLTHILYCLCIILTLVNCRRLNTGHNIYILSYYMLQCTNKNEYHQNQTSMSRHIVNNKTNFSVRA